MAKREQVMVRVSNDQKERWKQHADDEDKYRSLTNLVEQSVEERISDDNEQFTVEEQIREALNLIEQQQRQQRKIVELAETIEDTQATNTELTEQVEDLKSMLMVRLDEIIQEVDNDD